jgi:arsenate reductase/ArsR family transcriptional regulator
MAIPMLETATLRFKALGHPARLRILAALRDGELCVCQVTALLHLAPSTVSAHLADLRRAGFLTERRDGRWVYYGLASGADARRVLAGVWAALAGDRCVGADARAARVLRAVPVEEFCRMDEAAAVALTAAERRGTDA